MFLYHGTAERYLDAIYEGGIKPRRYHGRSNWNHTVLSNRNAVYLTNAYAIYYAQSAVKKGERMAILEIDTTLLKPWRLSPDEDFLEQATRKVDYEIKDEKGQILPRSDGTVKMMRTRTKWFRRRLLQYAHEWEHSVEFLGNCCYHDVIEPSAIKRTALFRAGHPLSLACDPTITLLNYRIMRGYYLALTKHVFGDTVADSELNDANDPLDRIGVLRAAPRDGIEVETRA